mmetsp:Transcript_22298/g.32457  ORF Transcript_22298/g.32457 Transcript_22298/m.32457 type:complete len:259 (-) Transcript_22298:135-911(-)
MSTPCKFFLAGKCTRGDNCRFLHEKGPSSSSPSVSPVIINVPPGARVYSIDVECAATSTGHNGRSVCSIGMVGPMGEPIANILVKSDDVVSYLTPLTGVTSEAVQQFGVSFNDAVAQVRSFLGPNVILVGQNILKDVQWLGLQEGVDYASLIDLVALFRVWNIKRNAWTNFSQDHVARVWLGIGDRASHNALEDAGISMALFNCYYSVQHDPHRLQEMQMVTLNTPIQPSYASRNGSIDGCCLGHRKTCTCDDAFYIS